MLSKQKDNIVSIIKNMNNLQIIELNDFLPEEKYYIEFLCQNQSNKEWCIEMNNSKTKLRKIILL